MVFCPNCGHQRNGDEKFCPHCGEPFNTPQAVNPTSKGDSNKLWLIILSIVAIAIVGLGCWLYLSKGNNTSSVSTINNSTEPNQYPIATDSIEEVDDSHIDSSESNYSEPSSSDNSSSHDNSDYYSETSSTIFMNAQYVVGYLANQRFTNYSDVEIRFDGDGRIFIDNDCAGVVSVLRYNETSALLRYGGGMYGEGKIGVRIEGNKLVLRDPIDGTEWYQTKGF